MTATTVYTRIMADARTRLPGSLDSNLQGEVFNVIDDFLRSSELWKEDIDVNVVANDKTYTVATAQSGAMILRLYSLVDANAFLVPATMAEVGALVLNTIPAAAAVLTATVILSTTEPVTASYPNCPLWILEKYRLRITDGLLSRMFSQPMKPYSNERLAIFHGQLFNAAKAHARVEGRTANLYGGQAWQFPRGFV